jgi:hypothetical protein
MEKIQERDIMDTYILKNTSPTHADWQLGGKKYVKGEEKNAEI